MKIVSQARVAEIEVYFGPGREFPERSARISVSRISKRPISNYRETIAYSQWKLPYDVIPNV